MDWKKELFDKNEKPLDRLVEGYSNTSLFRSIAVIGDSLSSGEFEIWEDKGAARYYDMYEYSWGQFLARNCGTKVYNFSRGGMTAEEYLDFFGEKFSLWGRDKACQAYIIALGVNDIYNKDMEIGSIEDVDCRDYRNNKRTFVGNYAAIVSRYKDISPDAKFFFVTVPNTDSPARDHKTFAMIDAIYSLAEHFDNAYVIDLYKYGPVHDETFREKFYLAHHMNPQGYLLMGKLIDSYIDYIIRHNPEDFKHVAFIGSGVQYEL